MPQYMLIMRGTDETNAAMMANVDEMMAATRRFIEETVKAGVYVAAEGLDDPGQGVVVHFSDDARMVTDGPYGETKELFGGGTRTCRSAAPPPEAPWSGRSGGPTRTPLSATRPSGAVSV